MARERTTIDEWEIHLNYGGGWEHECSEFTLFRAKETKKDYRENCPEYPCKIVKKRVKRSNYTPDQLASFEKERDDGLADARAARMARWEKRRAEAALKN